MALPYVGDAGDTPRRKSLGEISMRLLQPDPATALVGLRAMKMVASASGEIGPSQRALMEAAKRVILHVDADIDTLAPITPDELAKGFVAKDLRGQFVNGLLVAAIADGPPSREAVARIDAYAKALGVTATEITDLRRLAEHHMVLFKADFLRRSQIGSIMRNQLEQHGLVGMIKSVLGMNGLIEDKALAARYRAWEKLPPGTLGRELIDFYNRNGFAVPGELNGFPEAGLYHDFCHVLGGYSTEPEGEVQVAAFSAAFTRKRPRPFSTTE